MDVYSGADVLNAFMLTLLSLFAGDETSIRWLSGAAISFAYLYHLNILSVCIDCVGAPNFNKHAPYLLIQFLNQHITFSLGCFPTYMPCQ